MRACAKSQLWLPAISLSGFPKTESELRTHLMCFSAAGSIVPPAAKPIICFVLPLSGRGAFTHDLFISNQKCHIVSCHLLTNPKNCGTQKTSRMVDNSQVMCLHMCRVKTVHMSSAQRMRQKIPHLFPCHLTLVYIISYYQILLYIFYCYIT